MFKSEVVTLKNNVVLKRKIGEGSFVGVKKPRTPEEVVEWYKHLYAYKYASDFAENRCVLDVGCGTGYGVRELSDKASLVVGIDIWKDGISYAHREYGDKAPFLASSALNLPFRDSFFDLVISFQVIEHVEESNVFKYLQEIKRVLKEGGMFIVVTPNRKLRLLPFQKPWNSDHKREYDAKEFDRVLKKVFKNFKVFGLFATREAYLIEYYRVKQHPLFVYILNPISAVMKNLVPNHFLQMMKRIIASKTDKNKNADRYSTKISTNNFKLSHENLDSCIDLYAIGTKVQ